MILFAHQRRFVEIAREHPRYAWFAEPGVGKTIGVLSSIADGKARGFTGRTLVLAPKSILRCAWAQDAANVPSLTVAVVWDKSAPKRSAMIAAPGVDVFITNYETFKKHADDFWRAGVRRLVIDESSKVKAFDSQISKLCHKFSDHMESVYLLSGTPAPNEHTEYWSQIRCLDKSLFGPSYWQFCYRYFSPIKRVVGDKERIIGWRAIKEREGEFQERLRSVSWSLRKADCLDLPEQTDVMREVVLSDAEFNAYVSMLQELRVEFANGETVQSLMAGRVMKLRQLTGGAVYHDGKARETGRAKIEELLAVLEEIGPQQVVVWAEFTSEIDRIAKALPGAVVIDGRTPAEARGRAVSDFQRGELRRLVCHPAAAGHGITLTAASYAIYFSHGFSFEQYQQSRDRIHRAGQKKPCTYYHLTAAGTIDERVLNALRHKRSMHETIMEMLGTASAEPFERSNGHEVRC